MRGKGKVLPDGTLRILEIEGWKVGVVVNWAVCVLGRMRRKPWMGGKRGSVEY